MLTSIYYYNLYRPYIVGSRETNSPKRGRIADRRDTTSPESSGQMYILNKSLKDEIVKYAHNVSYGVTNLRASTRQTATDMENFNRDIHSDGLEKAKEWLADDLQEFATQYNASTGFMQSQKHSTDLRSFSCEVADNLFYNQERLSMLGFSLSESGQLSFSRDHLDGLSQDQINIAIGENIQIFSDMSRHTDKLLSEPLSEYMDFKGLSYHYNYKMGTMVTDGFGIIESGLLIDKVV